MTRKTITKTATANELFKTLRNPTFLQLIEPNRFALRDGVILTVDDLEISCFAVYIKLGYNLFQFEGRYTNEIVEVRDNEMVDFVLEYSENSE